MSSLAAAAQSALHGFTDFMVGPRGYGESREGGDWGRIEGAEGPGRRAGAGGRARVFSGAAPNAVPRRQRCTRPWRPPSNARVLQAVAAHRLALVRGPVGVAGRLPCPPRPISAPSLPLARCPPRRGRRRGGVAGEAPRMPHRAARRQPHRPPRPPGRGQARVPAFGSNGATLGPPARPGTPATTLPPRFSKHAPHRSPVIPPPRSHTLAHTPHTHIQTRASRIGPWSAGRRRPPSPLLVSVWGRAEREWRERRRGRVAPILAPLLPECGGPPRAGMQREHA